MNQTKDAEVLDGIPILDATVILPNPDNPRFGLIRTVRCPFCGYCHLHGDVIDVAVGALLHRVEHCTSYRPGGFIRAKSLARGYYLRITANPFLDLVCK